MTERPAISREYPPVPLVGVGALVVGDGRVLLIKRGNEPSKGQWSIPGGLVKVGESLRDAVVREALEETGLLVQPEFLVELLERIFRDDHGRIRYHYVLADFRCSVVDGSMRAGSDALEAAWFDRKELNGLELAPVTMAVILKALDHPGR